MGYYACASGDIALKKTIEELRDVLDEIFDGTDFLYSDYYVSEDCTIDIEYDDNYHSDEVKDMLDKLKPYTKKGCVTFTGEDNTFWRFVFNPEKDEWEEQQGKVVFQFDSFADEELIEEIIKRGYKVS